MAEHVSDALITLGGGTNKKGVLFPRSLARIDKSIDEYRAGRAPRIIVVGGYWLMTDDSDKPKAVEAQQMEERALARGVPLEDIIKAALLSRETIGNALFAKKEVLEPNGWSKIDVVTSRTHLPRSLKAFEHVLGPDYEVNGIAAPEGLIIPKMLYEVVGSTMQNYVLDGTKPGDDEAIHTRLIERVPGYDNDATTLGLAAHSLTHAAARLLPV